MLYLIAWLTDCALILFVFSSTRVLADAQADAMGEMGDQAEDAVEAGADTTAQ